MSSRCACRLGISTAHFGARFFGCEHPVDAGALGVASLLPGGGFGDEARVAFDAPVEALESQDADLDLHHVQPTGVLGDIVELQSTQHPSGFVGRKRGWTCPAFVESVFDFTLPAVRTEAG